MIPPPLPLPPSHPPSHPASHPTEIAFHGDAIGWTLDQDVVEVTLHRAPGNAIGSVALSELERLAAFVEGGAGGARALVLHSVVPGVFSEGADLRELWAGLRARRQQGVSTADIVKEVRAFLDRIHAVLDTLDMAPLTTVAAVGGVCFGGGLEVALTCDVIVADKGARFALPELRLGLIPGWGAIPRLRRDVGNATIRDLLLTGRSLGAARAHALGLVSQCVGRGDALRAAHAVARQASRFEPRAARVAKRFVKHLPRHELTHEKELFCELFASPAVEAALARFCASDSPMPYLP